MKQEKGLQQKASALREELVAAKESRAANTMAADADASERQEPPSPVDESAQRDLQAVLKDLADCAQSEMKERPMVSVAVAFVLGLVVGRLLSR